VVRAGFTHVTKGDTKVAADMNYEGELRVIWVVEEGKDRWFEKVTVPVASFEVDGGTQRTINLASTNDVAASTEFEQARTFKNITFFITPTKDFAAAKLIGLRSPEMKFFSVTFLVCTYHRGKKIQSLQLQIEKAWFTKVPTPVGDTPPLLKADVRFHETLFLHGHLNSKGKFIHQAI
jgi:hypothetical protein